MSHEAEKTDGFRVATRQDVIRHSVVACLQVLERADVLTRSGFQTSRWLLCGFLTTTSSEPVVR